MNQKRRIHDGIAGGANYIRCGPGVLCYPLLVAPPGNSWGHTTTKRLYRFLSRLFNFGPNLSSGTVPFNGEFLRDYHGEKPIP